MEAFDLVEMCVEVVVGPDDVDHSSRLAAAAADYNHVAAPGADVADVHVAVAHSSLAAGIVADQKLAVVVVAAAAAAARGFGGVIVGRVHLDCDCDCCDCDLDG